MSAMDTILVVNAGSSSVKFQLFEIGGRGDPVRQIKGQIDGIGSAPRLRASSAAGQTLTDRTFGTRHVGDVRAALDAVAEWLRREVRVMPVAVGHRVVHGGPDYDQPMLVDDALLRKLETYSPLAPLHQPNNLAPIHAIRSRFPQLPQVACFDTAFHRHHGPLADRYAIPEWLHAEGVRRYGFHGLSYEYIASVLPRYIPTAADGRVIVAHLGSGASMCALVGGRSVESTLGFTALDGLPMGTRSGQIDPGVVLYLFQNGMSAAEVEDLLYRQCGLKGLSGISNDVRELLASGDPRAALALDYFVYRAGLSAGMLAAAMGGLDAFVFTAGIGENSPAIRARIAEKLAWLGADINPIANATASISLISSMDSRTTLLVIPTDEELMIARHTLAVLEKLGSAHDRRIA
jgi:acetate kinase